ncbi:MAG: LptF/LptG family permease [Alphaproteobacteria bacterium]|nr:LptF/LptG family permease [Alphaproteobacteria bacterium]
MIRAGWHVTATLGLSLVYVSAILWSLGMLAEFIGVIRAISTGSAGNPLAPILEAGLKAFRWNLELLPLSVLIAGVMGIANLQQRNELLIMKSAGASIWGIMRMPVAAAVILGIVVSFALDGGLIAAQRATDRLENVRAGSEVGTRSGGWFVIEGVRTIQHVFAERRRESGAAFTRLRVIATDLEGRPIRQLTAKSAEIVENRLVLFDGTIHVLGQPPKPFTSEVLDGMTGPVAVRLALGATDGMTYAELREVLASNVLDPAARDVAKMRVAGMEALPLVLVGSLLIAFAFTAGYRRTGASGSIIFYGIVLGLGVFVLAQLAYQAGSRGVLDVALAAWGPAIVAIVIGVTVLLHVEDG